MLIQWLSGMLHYTITFWNREDKLLRIVGLKTASRPGKTIGHILLDVCLSSMLQVGGRFRFFFWLVCDYSGNHLCTTKTH